MLEWRKKGQVNEEELETDMTSELLCEHDQLNTNAKNRRAVSEEIWNYLHSIYPSAIPVPCKDVLPCVLCEQAEQEEENLISSRQQQRAELKKEVSNLIIFSHSLN